MNLFVFTFCAITAALAVLLAQRKFCVRQQVAFVRETLDSSTLLDKRRIIVSFSTLPDRIANLRPTLTCLIEQTRPPDEIVLAVPDFSVRQRQIYSIPECLAEFPLLRILRSERDWGPATKSIPVVQQELGAGRVETLIVVVDDDRIYPRDMIETYLCYNAKLPDAALCFRGAPMPHTFDWRDSKQTYGHTLRGPKRVAVMTGCGSYLVMPKFFDSSFWDYSDAPPAAFYMDDIWISGSLDRRGVKKYVIPASRAFRSVRQQARTMTLHDVPDGRIPNNNDVIRFFRSSWNVFPESATHKGLR